MPGLEAMETKLAQDKGKFTDERDLVAWGPRLQALDMAFNLKGSYAAKQGRGWKWRGMGITKS
ncbi:MAG: hypothetical protein ABSF14_02180 [Terriglobia bacterium]